MKNIKRKKFFPTKSRNKFCKKLKWTFLLNIRDLGCTSMGKEEACTEILIMCHTLYACYLIWSRNNSTKYRWGNPKVLSHAHGDMAHSGRNMTQPMRLSTQMSKMAMKQKTESIRIRGGMDSHLYNMIWAASRGFLCSKYLKLSECCLDSFH